MTGSRILTAAALVAVCAAPAAGQRADYTPPELEGIEITDHSGQTLSPSLKFTDENGNSVTLGDYLDQGKPLVVNMLYYNCPMLCSLVLNGFVEGAKEIDWTPGKEYTVLSVSFDPTDKPEAALAKKANYVESLDRPGAGEGWHFLTGEAEPIRELAQALGFPYRYVEGRDDQYSHAAGLFVVAPDGKISRTLYGISFPAQTLRFSLMDASQGKLGSPLQKLVLFCFAYNSGDHKYTPVARNVMKLGGGLSAAVLFAVVGLLWWRDRRRRPVLVA